MADKSKERAENFVSVSGISDGEELRQIGRFCQESNFPYPVVIGYQVSNKSINQRERNTGQPEFSELGELVEETLEYGFTPAIHYYTEDNRTVLRDLEKIANIMAEPIESLLQFNTLPFSAEILRKSQERGFKNIFKVPISDKSYPEEEYTVWKEDNVIDIKSGEVGKLVEQVRFVKDYIDYVMFNPSHGTKLDLGLDENSMAVRFGNRIVSTDEFSHLGLVYAGGINPENVGNTVRALNQHLYRKISVDAESGVRNEENELDMNKVEKYLQGYRDALA